MHVGHLTPKKQQVKNVHPNFEGRPKAKFV